VLTLQMSERKAATDPEAAARLRRTAVEQARQGIADLRDLAAGIHPGILTDRGLVAAVDALASGLPLPVAVEHDLPRRLPAPVEASVYFFVSEALTNVAKHARANEARVVIHCADDRLVVEVSDDGVGGATTGGGGTGLAGLEDRIAALDGELADDELAGARHDAAGRDPPRLSAGYRTGAATSACSDSSCSSDGASGRRSSIRAMPHSVATSKRMPPLPALAAAISSRVRAGSPS
jgi:hypothetical protein